MINYVFDERYPALITNYSPEKGWPGRASPFQCSIDGENIEALKKIIADYEDLCYAMKHSENDEFEFRGKKYKLVDGRDVDWGPKEDMDILQELDNYL